MGANSLLRRIVKKAIHPFIGEKQYIKIQAASQAHDITSGNWFEPEIELLKYAVSEGDSVLDLGANFGQYAFYLSKAVGDKGKVYSFEPIPYTFQTLSLVAEKLGLKNVTLVNKGCGNENATVSFSVPLQESGAFAAGQSYIGTRNDEHEGKENQVRWQGTKDVECEIVCVDDFLPNLPNLSLIKADVEGAELFAFQGAAKHIELQLPTVICEINPWFLEGFGVKLENLTDFFFEKGYKMFFYKEKMLIEVKLEDIVEDNYIFIHPSKFSKFNGLFKN
jgi:FkbM family methyltransferase